MIYSTVQDLPAAVKDLRDEKPGILLVGEIAAHRFLYRQWGALEGGKVLLTCSAVLIERAARAVRNYGGIPVRRPLIRLVPDTDAARLIDQFDDYDWIVITSPSAVDCLLSLLTEKGKDIRTLPRILVSGERTAAQLRRYNLIPDAVPVSGYGSESVIDTAGRHIDEKAKVLRVRSDAAGNSLAEALRKRSYEVTDWVLYRNERVDYGERPSFDAVLFASGSAVRAFAANWGVNNLQEKRTAAIGESTAGVLISLGLEPTVIAREPTVEAAITALAAWHVNRNFSESRIRQ